MENGQPPDPKRQRMHEQPQGWNREHPPPPDRDGFARPPFQLPPPTPSSHSPGPPRSSVPFAHPLEPPRRHSDHSPYDQDPNRPGSQPHIYSNLPHHNHHNQSYGGPRETMVKRDPAEESVQFRQPPPLRTGLDHHERPQVPPYDTGPQHPGIQYRPPPPPPQYHAQNSPNSPLHPSEGFAAGYGAHGLPGPQAQYGSVSYPTVSSAVKRKAQRAAQACDNCRTLKAKCDEGRPSCQSCRDKNIVCSYRDPPPKQQDKTSNDILEGMNELKTMFFNMDKKIDRLEREIHANQLSGPGSFKQEQTDMVKLPTEPSPSIQAHMLPSSSDGNSQRQSFSSEQPPRHIPLEQDPYSSTLGHEIQEKNGERQHDPDTEEEEVGEPVNVETKPSIPLNHTTGAARLLLVAPIRELAKEIMNPRRGPQYPLVEERRRGNLRYYGRGEGQDRTSGYERDSVVDHGAENTPSDSGPDTPSPPGEEWGQLGGLTPPGDDSNVRLHIPRGTVIGPEGMPDISKPTVLRLVESYKQNINILHPILIPSLLDKLVASFLKSIPESHAKSRQIPTTAISSRTVEPTVFARFIPESPGNKRKRSPASATDSIDLQQTISEFKPGHPFRSMTTALVFLVMALGAICEHKTKIPEVAADRTSDDQHDSPITRNGYPRSPMQNSPILSTPTTLPSSPDANPVQSRSRRASLDGGPGMPKYRERPRNIDIIPGLSYFALASDIIGNQIGADSLQHAHANILACLYHGQLGRILESNNYLSLACRSVEVLLRTKIARLRRLKIEGVVPPATDNPLLIAFWTCLQLESDIIAEVDCVYSGILKYEELLPLPNIHAAVLQDNIDETVMKHWNLQLMLRKHLNQLHGMFYQPASSVIPGEISPQNETKFQTLNAMEESLTAIRNTLWNDEDPPAGNILDARLRAKFYGARVISYRTYITQILEREREGEVTVSDHYKPNISVPQFNVDAKQLDDLHPRYVKYAKEGVRALIQSTVPFHGLGDPGQVRLIVTNIWGTTHAQFGNVLTLLAVYKDPILGSLVNPDMLRQLVSRTLRFIDFNAQPRSALHTDFLILHNAALKTGMLHPDWKTPDLPSNPNSSFGSNSNGDSHMGDH